MTEMALTTALFTRAMLLVRYCANAGLPSADPPRYPVGNDHVWQKDRSGPWGGGLGRRATPGLSSAFRDTGQGEFDRSSSSL